MLISESNTTNKVMPRLIKNAINAHTIENIMNRMCPLNINKKCSIAVKIIMYAAGDEKLEPIRLMIPRKRINEAHIMLIYLKTLPFFSATG